MSDDGGNTRSKTKGKDQRVNTRRCVSGAFCFILAEMQKSVKKEWSALRAEIEQVRIELQLPDSEFSPVGLNDWQQIEENIHKTFCHITHHKAKPAWLWEYFKLPTYSVATNGNTFQVLEKLTTPDETIWLFVNETVREQTKFWFYEGRAKVVLDVLQRASYNEFYLASKKYEWLLCVNHHDVLFATGKDKLEKLRDLLNR